MSQIYTILFDLDGTIVNTAPDLMAAHNHVMKKYGHTEKKLSDIKSLAGKGAWVMMQRSFKIVFEKEADDKNQLYGSISKKEILDFLDKNKIKVKSDDLIIKESIKSIGEHFIEINPYIDISEEFKVIVNKN